MTLHPLVAKRFRELVHQHGSLREAGRVLGFKAPYLSRVRSGQDPPSDRLLEKMGLRREVKIVEIKK